MPKRRRDIEGDEDDEPDTADQPAGKKQFQEGQSVRQEAEKHRILVARMPIHSLTTEWSIGQNRPVDRQQAARLCTIFRQGGLNRCALENQLLVLCTGAQAQRLRGTHDGVSSGVEQDGEEGDEAPVDRVYDLRDLPPKDHGEEEEEKPFEVMAGQHRLDALRRYVAETGASEDELWWTCRFYNRGIVLPRLSLSCHSAKQ